MPDFESLNRERVKRGDFVQNRIDEIEGQIADDVIDAILEEAGDGFWEMVEKNGSRGVVGRTVEAYLPAFERMVDEMEKVEPESLEDIAARIGIPLWAWKFPGEDADKDLSLWQREAIDQWLMYEAVVNG